MSDRLSAVLDTSILVAAWRSRRGASNLLLEMALDGLFEVAATNAVFLEYEDVLQREHQRQAHGQTAEEVDAFLVEFAALIRPVEVYFSWRPQLTDNDDEMILDAAINGRVHAIVTHNRKDFLPAAERFGIRVLSPAEFLKEVKR